MPVVRALSSSDPVPPGLQVHRCFSVFLPLSVEQDGLYRLELCISLPQASRCLMAQPVILWLTSFPRGEAWLGTACFGLFQNCFFSLCLS